ncbi:hypothetical protein JVX88_16555 [Leptolyngbya sp. 7M]|nr:hypothetical protein JVX88_16555 [Leptolyngbya sp. 7M]
MQFWALGQDSSLWQLDSSFLPQLGPLLESGKIKGLAHITGGGFLENIPRILPEGVGVEINRGSWHEPPIFGMMQRLGNVADEEMFRTFNIGIGMVAVCSTSDVEKLSAELAESRVIGKVVSGSGSVSVI